MEACENSATCPTTRRTVAQSLRHEIAKIKGSRFIASVAPVASVPAAQAWITAERQQFPDASHHCFAWRLSQPAPSFRSSDDGEPSGTAGRPILQQIDHRLLTDVVVVVTRYFGGTKLGTGGLVRAYSAAAAAVLDRAEIREEPLVKTVRLIHSYALTGEVQRVLHAFGLKTQTAQYGVQVQMAVTVPQADLDRLRSALQDATAGNLSLRVD